MNIEPAFLVTTGQRYEQQNSGISRSAEVFNKREAFGNLNEAITALNKIPGYYFSAGLASQYQTNQSLDYALVHDSDGVIKVSKIYLGWGLGQAPGIDVTLHDITAEEYNKILGGDLTSNPSLSAGSSTAYKVLPYEQLEQEVAAIRQRKSGSRCIRPGTGHKRNIR